MATFTTFKRWRIKDGKDESDLLDIVSNQIIPHYRQLDLTVQLGLLRIDGTRSYLALQHWPSRAQWKTVTSSEKFKSWFQEYQPILETWEQIMEFEAEWETEDLLSESESN
ncbi:hypothetical protein KFU94_24335 [Chloroflexi bacterium TSY]|nr:hypothetical protein [Chloroflexi bacterium TSY]